MKHPYKYWTRDYLYEFLLPQCIDFDVSTSLVKLAVYDERWNPRYDFNGCTLVQDEYHPFLPCFIHDWRWITGQGGLDSDIEFKINLVKAGFTELKAWKYFIGVRLGWMFYYKWTK